MFDYNNNYRLKVLLKFLNRIFLFVDNSNDNLFADNYMASSIPM